MDPDQREGKAIEAEKLCAALERKLKFNHSHLYAAQRIYIR